MQPGQGGGRDRPGRILRPSAAVRALRARGRNRSGRPAVAGQFGASKSSANSTSSITVIVPAMPVPGPPCASQW